MGRKDKKLVAYYRGEAERVENYHTVGVTRYVIRNTGEEVVLFWCELVSWRFWKPAQAVFAGRFKLGENDSVIDELTREGVGFRNVPFETRQDLLRSTENNNVLAAVLAEAGGDLNNLYYVILTRWFGEPPGQQGQQG